LWNNEVAENQRRKIAEDDVGERREIEKGEGERMSGL